jgi:hypothetical protein
LLGAAVLDDYAAVAISGDSPSCIVGSRIPTRPARVLEPRRVTWLGSLSKEEKRRELNDAFLQQEHLRAAAIRAGKWLRSRCANGLVGQRS